MNLPKKIHFTCPNKNKIENPIWVECLNKYYELYDDYEIILYDDSDIYDIIGKHYPLFLEKIKKISVGAVLSDLFRYLILYLEGGIYSDLDCLPLKKIDPLLDETYRYFHGDENRDNNLFVYEKIEGIIDNRWDFCGDVCDNSVVLDYDYYLGMKTLKCLGHSIDIKNTSTILSYEVHNDWHQVDQNLLNNEKICYKNLGIAQWFIITEPKQEIFLKMFMSCMDNLDALVNIKQNAVNVNRDDYHYNVISKSGPLAFTKTVVDNMSDKIKILPSDFFCGGSWGKVPFTKNSYISHKFTSSWLGNRVITVGDSHALHGWIDFHSNTNKHTYGGNTGLDLNEQWVDNMFIKSHSFAGTLCYTFNKQDFDRFDISSFDICDGDILIFSFGEIDCRSHVHKYINGEKSYKEIITPIVNDYFYAIKREINKLNKNLKKICVYNIIPPTEKKYLDIAGHVSCIGSDEERKKYYQYFNELIKNNCLENNFTFIDVYKEHSNVRGYLDRKYSDGGGFGDFHLKKSEHIFNFLKNNII